jgi:hypothetical protein
MVEADKEFDDIFDLFGKVIEKGYEKYNNLSKLFDNKYEADYSVEARAIRDGFNTIIDCYKNAIMFYGTIDTSSSNDYVDIIIEEMKKIQNTLQGQINNIICNLRNIKDNGLLEDLVI